MMHLSYWFRVPLFALCLQACGQDSAAEADPQADAGLPDAGPVPGGGGLDAALRPDSATVNVPLPPPTRAAQCSPGLYQGKFDCLVNGLPIWGGEMRFTLESTEEGSGEFRQLRIVPGTRLQGSDPYAGRLDAELNGTFDCDTGVLTGKIENGVYMGFWGTGVSTQGPLTGNYQEGTPPGFQGEMGPLSPENPDALSPMALCKWSTSLSADAGVTGSDAGR